MKLQRFIILATLFLLSISSGCTQPKSYSVPSNFIEIPYQGKKGNFLGKRDGDILKNVYGLNGLESNEFIYLSEANIIGNSPSSTYILMDNNVKEPILRYKLTKIEFLQDDNIVTTVNDNNKLNDILSIRKGEEYEKSDWIDPLELNATFYFDLPCKLVWKCRIEFNKNNTVKLICFDVSKDAWYSFDVSSVLSEYFL